MKNKKRSFLKPSSCNRFENRDERDGGSFDIGGSTKALPHWDSCRGGCHKTADNGNSIGKDFANKNAPYLATNSKAYCRNWVKLARAAARIADDKKASEVTVLSVTKLTTETDYVVIATTESAPQTNAIYQEIKGIFKKDFAILPLHFEMSTTSSWSVLDFGGVLVHIMPARLRELYALDKIWANAGKIKF